MPCFGHDKIHGDLHVTTLAFKFLHPLFEVMGDFGHVVVCRTEDKFVVFFKIHISGTNNDKFCGTPVPETTGSFHDEPHIFASFHNLFTDGLNGLTTFIDTVSYAAEKISNGELQAIPIIIDQGNNHLIFLNPLVHPFVYFKYIAAIST